MQTMKILNPLGFLLIFFSKTSSRENIEFVQYVFNELDKKGHIYVQDVTQFYCEHDKKFLPDRYVKVHAQYVVQRINIQICVRSVAVYQKRYSTLNALSAEERQ